jgi:hypothetical protein
MAEMTSASWLNVDEVEDKMILLVISDKVEDKMILLVISDKVEAKMTLS